MTYIDTVTSRTNPTVRLVRSLTQRRATRYRERLFVAEGLRTIQTLIGHGCRLERLLLDTSRIDEIPASLLAAADVADAIPLRVEPSLFTELSDVDAPQPAIGVFAMPAAQPPAAPSVVLVLDGIQDPGNLGSILRTCRATAVDAVLMSRGTVDPYSPKVVRATAGQFAGLALIPAASPTMLADDRYRDFPRRIVLAGSGGVTPYAEFDWTEPFILVLGNEGAGSGQEWSSRATDRVRIPMAPGVESLNVAASAAVLLYESRRAYAFE